MSKLEGGIFSRPRGKTGGIVFGAARTRRGKLVTTRLLVPPSNPRTASQQAQRGLFAEALNLVKAWGPDVYQSAFNRTVSQLPGFQSMLSILMLDPEVDWFRSSNATFLRGSNPLPAGVQFDHGGPGEGVMEWSPTPQQGGSATDEVHFIVTHGNTREQAAANAQYYNNQTIADGAVGYTFQHGDQNVLMFYWVVGAGSANAGIYSNVLRAAF